MRRVVRQRQEEWSYVAPAPVLEYTVDWHRTRSVGLQLQSCEGVPRRSPPKWRTVFVSRRHLKGCVKVCSTWALVDGLRRHSGRLLLRQQRRCGVTLADCCCGSRDVAAPFSLIAVAAAKTLRRHSGRLLLRQQRRCGVTLADCCCGSRDVAASHSQTAVAAAVTLQRHTRKPVATVKLGRQAAWRPRCICVGVV